MTFAFTKPAVLYTHPWEEALLNTVLLDTRRLVLFVGYEAFCSSDAPVHTDWNDAQEGASWMYWNEQQF